MAKEGTVKTTAETTRCRSISVDVVIPKDDFDPSALGEIIVRESGKDWDLTTSTVSGPLRMGGKPGASAGLRLIGRSAFHSPAEGVPHYHISVYATKAAHRATSLKDVPTVRQFFSAVAKGIRDENAVMVNVVSDFTFPRDWWTGEPLPVPLPPHGEQDYGAQLTGVEVTYDSDAGFEKVFVTAEGDTFGVVTFLAVGSVAPGLFEEVSTRAADLAARLFVNPRAGETKV